MTRAIQHLFIAFLIGLILCPPQMALAGGITPDAAAPAAHQASMDAAQNGVPVVNIVAPNGSGMSHNMFTDFNVGAQGVIINNGIAPGVSQLGGALAQNPNFSGQAASTILNEVTGAGRSSIQGYTEIFGQSANYILANPNGISINGGGFINTPRATLTTGVPQYSGGAFQGVDVRGGDVLVEGAGVNADNIDAFAIVTRAAQINAAIYAKKLSITTGQNRLNPATGATAPLAPDGSAAPSVAIDSAALGGMYAGRITLIGTEAGVGVNTLGPVQATERLEMTVDGKIQIKGTASSGQDLALTSTTGEVEVSGKVRAAGTATLTGQTVTVAKADPADAAIVSAARAVVNAGALNNDHLIAGDAETTVAATTVTNTGTIYSGGTALFRIGDTLYNNRGVILSKGDMVLEGSAAGQKMLVLQNDSGSIESLDGGLVFRAGTFNNNNSQFALVEGATELSYSEGGYWYHGDEGDECYSLFLQYIGTPRVGVANNAHHIPKEYFAAIGLDASRNVFTRDELVAAIAETDRKLAEDPNYLDADGQGKLAYGRMVAASGRYYIITGGGSGVVYAATTADDSATGQELGSSVAAQGDVVIEADDARNVVSKITSAAGDIVINANTFANVGKDIYRRTTIKWGRGIFQNHSSPSVIPLGGGTEVLLASIDYAYGTLDAGNRVIISSGAVANGVTERGGILSPPDPSSQQQKVADVTTLTGGLPSNGLFQASTNPAHNYLIETNPALANLDTFYGSDYALTRMGFDPNAEANKRLGDAFYETRQAGAQIAELTGRRFLNEGVTSDAEQFLALMNNAVQAHSDLGLSVGMALTAEQVAALASDIVWFEYREVEGRQVLVPVVYLCSASLGAIAQGGSVIAAGEVRIDTAGDTANAGLIASRGQVTITADNFFNNQGTVSGQAVAVTATDSIRNTGGDISGTDVALKAGNDVVIAADTITRSNSDTTYTQIARAGKVSASGDLSVEAGRDIGILGAAVEAGGDATLKADGNVAVSTMETTFSHSASGSDFDTRTDMAFNGKSTVTTGGTLHIEAGQDAAIHGSELESGGDTTLKAGGDVTITAATDSVDFHSHSEGSSGGFFGGKKSTTIDVAQQATVASLIHSGGSVTVEAGTAGSGDAVLHGSRIRAEGDVALKAEGNVQVTPNQVENYTNFQEERSGFMGTQSSAQDEARTVTNDRPEIEAGGKVALDAEQDVILQSARITSGDETEITAREGQVAMLVSKDSEYRRKVSSDMGFFSWSSKDEGSTDETVQHTEINAAKGLTITTAEGVVVEYKETGNVKEDIAQLAQAPGLEWMAEIANRDDVDWQAVQEVHDQWNESDSGVGGPGVSLVALAVAVALTWTGAGSAFASWAMGVETGTGAAVGSVGATATAGSVGGAAGAGVAAGATSAAAGATGAAALEGTELAIHTAIAAGFNSLVTQAAIQLVGNGGDVGAAMKALVSIDTVRSLATTMLTAGLTQGALDVAGVAEEPALLSQAESMEDATKILNAELLRTAIRTGIGAGVETAVNGGNLDENAITSLKVAAAASIGSQGAKAIGTAFEKGQIDVGVKYIAHAALGGVLGEITSEDAASGAMGAVVGEFTGEMLKAEIEEAVLAREITPAQALKWTDAGVDLSKLAAGLVAAGVGANVDVAADAGGNAAKNNVFFILGAAIIGLATLSEAQLALLATAAGAVLWASYKAWLASGGPEKASAWLQQQLDSMSLPDEQKQQLAGTPGSTATDFETGLDGSPAETNHNDEPTVTTPVGQNNVGSLPASEDQSGQVDSGGVIAQVGQYKPVPDEYKTTGGLPGIKDAEYIGKQNGRFTWATKNKVYEWDSQHGKLETYNKGNKEHLGETDPKTGLLDGTKKDNSRKLGK